MGDKTVDLVAGPSHWLPPSKGPTTLAPARPDAHPSPGRAGSRPPQVRTQWRSRCREGREPSHAHRRGGERTPDAFGRLRVLGPRPKPVVSRRRTRVRRASGFPFAPGPRGTLGDPADPGVSGPALWGASRCGAAHTREVGVVVSVRPYRLGWSKPHPAGLGVNLCGLRVPPGSV